ncbi:MAG: OadG family protein [bacterium]|nr:OadG family protein [bacterium]
MLVTGLIITVIGMTTVFAFLGIMVGVIDITGRVIQAVAKCRPQEETPVVTESAGAVRDEEIAAVIAAIHAL